MAMVSALFSVAEVYQQQHGLLLDEGPPLWKSFVEPAVIVAILVGNALVGVWKNSLIARLGPDKGEAALREPHVREFDITGRPMRNWVVVEPEGVEGDDQLKDWIERATTFVKSLPKK